MSVTTMTIDALCVSPFNPRLNQEDANAIDALENSLVARGQLYPLIVHPMKGKTPRKKRFGVLDGGRRFRAFARAIANGRLPKDQPIEVAIRETSDEGELHDLALAATFVRRELRNYEVWAATARAVEKGRTLADIADTNGQPVSTVRKWARLGNLHPTIFAALEAGDVNERQAIAFAATEDVGLQLHVFEQWIVHPQRSYGTGEALIRKLLKVGDRELEKMLRFVGETAYAEAGGRYELDLFADQAEQRGRVADEGLLLQLADAKLDRIRTRARAQARRDLRFEPAPPRLMIGGYEQGVDNALEIVAEPEHEDFATAAAIAWVDYEMAYLVEWARFHAEDADLSEGERALCIAAIDVQFLQLEDYRAYIEDSMRLDLPEGQVYATLQILDDGEPELRFWWANRKEKQKAEAAARLVDDPQPVRPVSAGPIGQPLATPPNPAKVRAGAAIDGGNGYGARQIADTLARDEHGLTADGVQVMRSIRREILRAALVEEAGCALSNRQLPLDYLLWSLARERLTPPGVLIPGARSQERGMAGLSVRHDVLGDDIRAHVRRTQAHRIWQAAVDELKAHPSMTTEDLVEAFDHFRQEAMGFRERVAAVIVGCALERSANAPGYEVELHDHLALLAGFAADENAATLAEPTEELLALLPMARQLELVHPHVTQGEYVALAKLKAAELPAPVVRALKKAKGWLHPLLRFRPRLIDVMRHEDMEAAA